MALHQKPWQNPRLILLIFPYYPFLQLATTVWNRRVGKVLRWIREIPICDGGTEKPEYILLEALEKERAIKTLLYVAETIFFSVFGVREASWREQTLTDLSSPDAQESSSHQFPGAFRGRQPSYAGVKARLHKRNTSRLEVNCGLSTLLNNFTVVNNFT